PEAGPPDAVPDYRAGVRRRRGDRSRGAAPRRWRVAHRAGRRRFHHRRDPVADRPAAQRPLARVTAVRLPTFATRRDAVACAEQLAVRLRERVRETDALRRLPDENVAELLDSGLCFLLVPRRMGGSEL